MKFSMFPSTQAPEDGREPDDTMAYEVRQMRVASRSGHWNGLAVFPRASKLP